MPLRPTTVRFAEDGMDFVQRAADEVGSTTAQFIREAALIRAAMILCQIDGEDEMMKVAEMVRRLSRDESA